MHLLKLGVLELVELCMLEIKIGRIRWDLKYVQQCLFSPSNVNERISLIKTTNWNPYKVISCQWVYLLKMFFIYWRQIFEVCFDGDHVCCP